MELLHYLLNMANQHNEEQLNVCNGDINHIITEEDVKLVIQKFTNDKSIKVLNYYIGDYSSNKLGYVGAHESLKITFQRSSKNSSETIVFFVKSIPYNFEHQANFIKEAAIFIKESNFFKIIPELVDNSDLIRWYPSCYLAKDDAIIMEDLREQGYKMHENIFDNTIALKSALVTLAHFHSCSILTEARLNQHSEKPIRLNERYPDYFDEKVFLKNSYGSRWFLVGANLASSIAERLGYNPIDVHNAYEQLFDIVKPLDKYCNVICHGDLWCNNFMFADSSPLLKCVLLDFQIIRYAPLVTDLLQFLHINATREFREKHEVDLVKFYHSTLEESVRRNDALNRAKVPTLQEILEDMDDLRVFGLVMATLYLPFTSLDPKIIGECTIDSDSYHKFVFEDRRDVVLSYMNENEHFKNKFEEVVIELIEQNKKTK